MEALLNDETLSDVTFVVGDARIPAHRVILEARSQYFRAMLSSGFREGQEPAYKRARTSGQEEAADITIGDTTPEAFRALLRYLYTDELRLQKVEMPPTGNGPCWHNRWCGVDVITRTIT